MAGNPPVDVQAFGQSIWYDMFSRRLIDSGVLQRLLDEDGVLGMTFMSGWPSRIFSARSISCARSMTAPTGATAMSASKFRR